MYADNFKNRPLKCLRGRFYLKNLFDFLKKSNKFVPRDVPQTAFSAAEGDEAVAVGEVLDDLYRVESGINIYAGGLLA